MRSIRHSSVSALPVETAMSGMLSFVSPAGTVGKKLMLGCALAVHAFTVMVYWRRHLPTWMTSGTLLPTGTLLRVKLPSTAVAALTTAPLLNSAPHAHESPPVGTPLGSGSRGAPGM